MPTLPKMCLLAPERRKFVEVSDENISRNSHAKAFVNVANY